jgi:hypothetical protein
MLLNGSTEHHLQVGLELALVTISSIPIEGAAEHPAQAIFLTVLPRHEPKWMPLTEGL